jgi:ADP-ribose pyrophosphatase YjhB (NUDIX family)
MSKTNLMIYVTPASYSARAAGALPAAKFSCFINSCMVKKSTSCRDTDSKSLYFYNMGVKHFNVRVYGILTNESGQVLVCDELIKGQEITKFPGGGLEFGEGTIDCLKREFMEETGNVVEVTEHFYTTDFYQVSAYNATHQIISIYYRVRPAGDFKITTTQTIFDFADRSEYAQTFRWIDLERISENDFTLPIDKIVGKMLALKK